MLSICKMVLVKSSFILLHCICVPGGSEEYNNNIVILYTGSQYDWVVERTNTKKVTEIN